MIEYSRFNKDQNYNKAVSEFYGIIKGIIADGTVVQREAEYLLNWMRRNEPIFDYAPALRIYEDLKTYLSDGYLDETERAKLTALIDNYNMFEAQEGDVTHLLGLCKGIVSDTVIKHIEAQKLFRFLRSQSSHLYEFPFNALFHRLQRFINKQTLEENDLEAILTHIETFTGEQAGITDLYADLSTRLPIDNPEPQVYFENRLFCLTGDFMTGTRADCENILRQLNAIPQKNVTMKTEYVVIGLVESTHWKYGNFGNKIKKAMDYRNDYGRQIKIVSESHWRKHF